MMQSNTYKKHVLSLVIILILVLAYLYFRPLPAVPPVVRAPAPPKLQTVALPWPGGGQSALGADGYGILATHGTSSAVPVGSTAKIITALAVLKQKPIAGGSQGPTVTLDAGDAALFNNYYTQGGSVTKVSAGEQITELQALQSMLLPSSNNMADSLAKWAFGSVNSYITYANKMAKNLGLKHTTVGDTNGFSDRTTSTAEDMVRLGLAAMKDPAISEVVGQTSTSVPVAGDIKNINTLLGQDGIYGVKTGFTEKAGGCYLFAARHAVSGQKISYVGAILSQPTLGDALNGAEPILNSADSDFVNVTPVHKGQAVAIYKAPWGANSSLISSRDISVLRWKGQEIRVGSELDSISAPAKAGTSPGKINVISGERTVSARAVLAQNLSGPSLGWRLFR
jgi:D-alanyl-D-alanine carboxypeptidase (penicillin-binding protein 5/6)